MATTAATRLILLGTAGGPRPHRARSNPAQVILVDGVAFVVDCGLGVTRQLVAAGVPTSALRYVFITHHHSDHNLEYGNLLYSAWISGLRTPVDAYGPPPLERMTRLYFDLNAYDIELRTADESRVPLPPLVHPHEVADAGVVLDADGVRVTAALVDHPPVEPSFAFRFDTPDRSIVISGDTAPCERLVELARGADVLVHEVMHVPAMERMLARVPNAQTLREHLIRSHTPLEQVGSLAAAAGVRTLVLSHVAPADDPSLDDETWRAGARQGFGGEIVVGHDLLEL